MFEEIIKSIPNCSVIRKEDQKLYESFIGGNNENFYPKNWQFIEQISQNSKGIKYFDKGKGHLLTIAPDWGGNLPNYIYLPLGENSIECLPHIAKELSKIIKAPVIIKKIYSEKNRFFLLNNGFQETIVNEYQEGDDKYPEIIVDVNLLIDSVDYPQNAIDMQYYKRRIRKFLDRITNGEWIISEKNLHKNIAVDFKSIVDKWSTDYALRSSKKGFDFKAVKDTVSSVYYPHFLSVCQNQTYCYITYINSQSVAFTSAYAISSSCLAVNGSLCDTSYNGLIQYLYLQLAKKAKNDGYEFLNLGSNDNESQDQYKARMGVVSKIYPYTFIYNN